MTEIIQAIEAPQVEEHRHSAGAAIRFSVIALTAFLTVVDLFATQAILPSLARHYGVSPAAMGFAVNASTLGMAFSGLAVGYFSREIDRRKGILISLVILAIPTALLAHAPDLTIFTLLRVTQGLCMAAAFTLTLAYLGEHYSAADSASAFAAYITGNVASNLIGRLVSAAVADHFGLASNFYFFAGLNLLGAVLVYFTIEKTPCMKCLGAGTGSHFTAWLMHLKNPLARELRHWLLYPVRVHRHLHLREFRAGAAAPRGRRHDPRFCLFRVSAGHGHHAPGRARGETVRHETDLLGGVAGSRARPTTPDPADFSAVLIGMVLVGVGTFFAQACATGFVGRAATSDRGSASGLYLACYFFGGLIGSAVLGVIFDMFGWAACVGGIAVSLLVAALLAAFLKTPVTPEAMGH